jgi:hypothetical protein
MSNYEFEDESKLSEKIVDLNRARQSLIEELNAIMWYDARAYATTDTSLKAVLNHNKFDEEEHASRLLEWLRRNDQHFEKELLNYLFTNKDLGAED